MKKTALMVLWLSLAVFAADRKPAEPARRSTALTLPATAKPVSPNTWTWTDDKGKVWTFRRTPFGLSKIEGRPDAAPATSAERDTSADTMTAVEVGDSVRFERQTPFGKQSWTAKKSELTDLEKKAWTRALEQKGKE